MKVKLNLKILFRTLTYSILLLAIIIIGNGVYDYLDYMDAKAASAGMPFQTAGNITLVRPQCILDTPASSPTTCAVSCPGVTTIWGPACTAYLEIDYVPQPGLGIEEHVANPRVHLASVEFAQAPSYFLAVPIGFQYSGGGTFPATNMQLLMGGASNGMPWVIGIPGLTASNIDKFMNWFDKYIIAGFKD